MTQQKRAENTRRALLEAAAAVFDEKGFRAASLTDVVARAGVTKGALYFHFSSKEELAVALLEEQFAVAGLIPDGGSEGVQAVIDLCHEMARNMQHSVRVRASLWLAIDQGVFAEPVRGPWLRWNDIIAGLLEEAGRAGELRAEVDPGVVANYVCAAFAGVQVSSHVLTGRADLRERITDMWKIILPGIVPPDRVASYVPSGRMEE